MERDDRPITLFPRANTQASTNPVPHREIRRADTPKIRPPIQKPLERTQFKHKVTHQVLPKQLHLALAAERPLTDTALGPSARRLTITSKDPNSEYQAHRKYECDPNICIAYRRSSRAMVTVLKLVVPNESKLLLFQTNHDNVLGIQECFRHEGNIFCVYDITLEYTLQDVSVSSASLEESALAAVFRDVIEGLRFIQIELKTPCGYLDMDRVAYDSKAGNFKLILASVAEIAPPTAQAVGYLMRQVMERESGLQPQARSVQLSQPASWSEEIQRFLLSTQTESCSQLLQVYHFAIKFPRNANPS